MQPSSFYRNDYQDRGALPVNQGTSEQQPSSSAGKPKRGGWKSWVPMAVGLGATLAAAPLTGGASLAGTAAILGGAGLIGGGAGEWAAQRLNKEKTDVGKIAKEGVINGALSAIPIGKVGQVAKGLVKKGAAGVAEQGVERAGAGGIRDYISSKLLKAADNTALRAGKVGGQKTAISGFKERFGEDLGTYIRKNGLVGKGATDVESDVIKGLNSKYGKLVEKIDRPISSSDVLAHNQKSLEKLLGSSSTANKKLSQDVFDELGAIFKKEGDAITPKRLNEIKAEFQANARNAYKLGANAKPGVDEKVAEYLKKTLQGVSGSSELATTGKELDKAYKASKIISKGEQVGRGNLSLSLGDAVVGAPLLAVNPVAAAGGVAAKRVINSPTVQSFIANKLASAGERVAGTAVKEVAAKGTEKVAETGAKALIKQTAKSQAIPRSIQALMTGGNAQQPSLDPTTMATPKYGAFDSSGQQNDQANIAALLGGGASTGSESQYSRDAMIADIKRDPKNSATYMNLYKELNPEPTGSDLSQTSRSALASSDNAINTLDQLEGLFTNAGGGSGRLGGKLKGIAAGAGFDESARVYNNLSQASVTQIAKALAGSGSGTVSDMDAKVIMAALPTISDTKTEAAAKFKALRQRLENAKSNTVNYGAGGGSDIQTLMMAQ